MLDPALRYKIFQGAGKVVYDDKYAYRWCKNGQIIYCLKGREDLYVVDEDGEIVHLFWEILRED